MDEAHSSAGHWEGELARLRAENELLRAQLEESQKTPRAMREGEVDALIVSMPEGERLFTLQGGEHPYRALLEQMLEGAALLTPQGVVHYCNGRIAEMLNLPHQQVLGTERKRAEETLRQAHHRLRETLESISDGFYSVDRDFVVTAMNSSAERILGKTRDELVGQNLWKHFPEAIGSRYHSEYTRAMTEGVAVHFEAYYAPLDHWTEVHVYPSSVGLAIYFHDITERKRTEKALAHAARQRALLVELAARIVAQRSVEELLATVVDAARELTEARLSVSGHGYLGDEFRVGMVSHAEGQPPCPPGEVFRIQKGGVYLEVIHRGPSLRLSEAELSSHPAWWGLPEGHALLRGLLGARLVDTQGQPCGLIMVSDKEGGGDFTEEDEAHLRQLASVTSLALGHIEARTAAEAANAAKSQFLANMSHELRTPMNAILGMLDVALPKATDPTVQDCLQTAKGSADLLLTLLNDLLDSAKIESGKLELESAPFSLRRMLDEIVRVLAVRASEKELSLQSRVAEKTPDALVGDRVRLQQVLLNLVGNAIKFTERGNVEIAVCIAGDDGSGMTDERSEIRDEALEGAHPMAPSATIAHPSSVTLEFAVRDTGIGIPAADQERLFEPFAQADASISRRYGGTGLGLSISKRLVNLMGGRIWLESALDEGSTFYFTVALPLAGKLPADDEQVQVLAAAARPLRVLLVEDNPANQIWVLYVLQERGHEVEVAGEGQEAVYLCQQNDYDAVLMDVQMPDMSGLEATAAIRQNEAEGRRVPIIAMTAHAMPGDRQRCLAAGMDGYLAKPVNGRQMIALIEELACGQPAAEEEIAAVECCGHDSRPSVFDYQLALARCFDSEPTVRKMIECFHTDMNVLFGQMREALQQGDLEKVGRLGHRMKGTVVYLGAEAAEEAALQVERFCTSSGGTAAEAEEAVNALEHECLVLKGVLSKHALAADLTPRPTP